MGRDEGEKGDGTHSETTGGSSERVGVATKVGVRGEVTNEFRGRAGALTYLEA